MNEKHQRPKAVWLLQSVLVVFCIALLIGSVRSSLTLIQHVDEFRYHAVQFAFRVAPRLGIASLLAWMVVAIHRGSRFGRIAGILVFLAWGLWQLVWAYSNIPAASPWKEAGHWFGLSVMLLIIIYWTYEFAFSAQAKRFFGAANTVGNEPHDSQRV